MDELIQINYEGEQPRVSGRDLHDALGISTKYADWFRRMCEYGFAEGTDYQTCFSNLGSEVHGGQNKVDHEMTIAMAKELCMIQRTEIGRKFRKYFIQVEEAWNTPEMVMARALQMANKTVEQLKLQNSTLTAQLEEREKVISQLQPKARYMDYVLQSKSLVLTTQIAKDYGMSAVAFNRKLNDMGIQFRAGTQWVLYAKYQNKGYAHSRTFVIPLSNGTTETKMQTEWTQKGRLFLYEQLKKEGILPLMEKEGEAVAGGSE
ncbi:MAG: phage antirepressor KilAC domain-containing protein [Lachnospiraceae bacterium]|nr:phage antirepressor KilAC domain-containing protein [Lachnospiraceae bacterium]